MLILMQTQSPFQGWYNPFAFSWERYAPFGVLIVLWTVLMLARRLPSMRSFKDFLDAINSAGGHIFLLALFAIYFFQTSMQFIYHALRLQGETVTKADALIMAGLTFVTGNAFGGAWSALLKTMTGGKANGAPPAPPADTLQVGFTPPADGEKKP